MEYFKPTGKNFQIFGGFKPCKNVFFGKSNRTDLGVISGDSDVGDNVMLVIL